MKMPFLESNGKLTSFTLLSVLSSILLILTVRLVVSLLIKRSKKIWLINQIPGPKAIPILGNALEVNVDPREIFARIEGYVKIWAHGKQFTRAWLAHRPVILLSRCHAVEVILGSQKHIDKSEDYSYLFPWLGTGLLTSTGKKWQSRRKMLTPAFHFKILDDFVDVFNQQSIKLASLLDKKCNAEPFDIFPFITLCTLDIIMETAMGRSIDAQNNSDSNYVDAVAKITALVQRRQSRPWLYPNILFKLLGYSKQHDEYIKILHDFSYETIRQRRKEHKEFVDFKTKVSPNDEVEKIGKQRKGLAFLDLLISYSEENKLTEEDIREEVDTFMFEGHDTTAAAINWVIYLLGCHPEIQKKIHEELDAIFEDSDRPVKSGDLKELKFLDCCIKEALRLFPSVPIMGRELKEEVVIDGYNVPSGSTVMIMPYRLHRDPEQFPEPEHYKPERFLQENSIGRHPYAYIPFSAGPRNCIGQKFAQMEEKVVLANILRKYRIESTIRREDMKILGELILRPEDGNIVKLYSRS